MRKLPKVIHVRWESAGQGEEPFLLASQDVSGVMDGDGPFRIGVYKLADIVEAKKEIITTKGVR